MRARVRFCLVGLFCVGAACSKSRDAVTQATPEPLQAAKPSESCSHAVCADNFFIDAVPADCAAGVACTVALKLVATGAFHINDEYPYRFKADDAAGLEFLGTDAGGKGTFSKGADDVGEVHRRRQGRQGRPGHFQAQRVLRPVVPSRAAAGDGERPGEVSAQAERQRMLR
jgi:hypothetical protein